MHYVFWIHEVIISNFIIAGLGVSVLTEPVSIIGFFLCSYELEKTSIRLRFQDLDREYTYRPRLEFCRHKIQSGHRLTPAGNRRVPFRRSIPNAKHSDALLSGNKKHPYGWFLFFVAGLGIEPKFSLSESDVLPLDDPAIHYKLH